MQSFKNIIFDLGGVILNIDYNRSVNAFRDLGVKNFQKIFSQMQQQNFVDEFEKGNLSAHDFRNEIRKFLAAPVSDNRIDIAWNAMLLDLPVERIKLLSALRKDHQLFLLSNTNEIHETAFNNIIKEAYGLEKFKNLFQKIYFSHTIHLRKPQREFFELVLNENKILAEETLFIDDSPQHVKGAGRLGIKGCLLEKEKTILDLF